MWWYLFSLIIDAWALNLDNSRYSHGITCPRRVELEKSESKTNIIEQVSNSNLWQQIVPISKRMQGTSPHGRARAPWRAVGWTAWRSCQLLRRAARCWAAAKIFIWSVKSLIITVRICFNEFWRYDLDTTRDGTSNYGGDERGDGRLETKDRRHSCCNRTTHRFSLS